MPDDTPTETVLSIYGDDEASAATEVPDASPHLASHGKPVPETPEAAPSPSPVAEEAPATPADADALSATTEVPSAPAVDVAALANAAKGDTTMTIVLGVIALAGAGTTWKFLTQFSEQRHEQRMKQLDIQERSAGLGSASPPPCQATNAELRAEIEGLKGRLSAVEKKSMSLSADFDGEDLERQVKKLAKTVKAMQEGAH